MNNPFDSNRSIFGWDLPPGCSHRDIDLAFGEEGPMDCPICVNGVELNGEDCPVCSNIMCSLHGCVVCNNLEKQRKYCAAICGDYIHSAGAVTVKGREYCSQYCADSSKNEEGSCYEGF